MARQKQPQVVLLDDRHSGKVFFEAIRRITEETGGACLLVGTSGEGSIVVERAKELGISAIVMENDDRGDLIRRLEQIGG